MKDVVIVSAARTAVGQFGQSLKDVPVVKLGGLVINEALKRAGIRPSKTKDKEFAPEIFGGHIRWLTTFCVTMNGLT
ncbi:acetyl-CoA acetyltransferase [Candidatus Moduliflexus flocculans]|uniref:Acetyl-CoA acetyltransferase n=1 Tax=Candidatus Moduliflexus flocculans TaxID=1499966 RepID=A0A081BRB8_9BACT|nr:acetyl-CoA acetyltransferase [Candidatus Moduliflexus flocculans]